MHNVPTAGSMLPLMTMETIAMVVFGVLNIILARKWTSTVTLIMLLLTLVMGVVGWGMARDLASANPALSEAQGEVGRVGANVPLYVGIGAGGVGMISLLIGAARRRNKERR